MAEAINTIDRSGFGEDIFIKSNKPDQRDNIRQVEGNPNGLETRVVIKDKYTGRVLYVGKNKTLLSGSEMIAMRLFNLENDEFFTPSYNTTMELDNMQVGTSNDLTLNYKVNLFCIGNSGCAKGSSIPYEVSTKKWIAPSELVPFQYVPVDKDLNNIQRGFYYGRKTLADRNHIAYYFKKFDSQSIVKKQLEDGTPWGGGIYDDQSALAAKVIVSQTMTIDVSDGRDYFTYTSGINDASFSTLSLLASWSNTIGGYNYYQDVRPVTRINFPTRYLSDLGMAWEVIYDIYL